MNPQDAQTNATLTPDAFKALIVGKYPDGKASDGTPYAKMDATDLTQRIVNKYPDGTTNDGHKYSDYLPKQTASPTSQPEKKPGFLQSAVQTIANPFLTMARTPVGLAEQGLGAITGNDTLKQSGQLLASGKDINDPFFGKIGQLGYDENGPKSVGNQVTQAAGIAGQVAPYFMGAGELEGLRPAQSTLPGLIKTGIKTGAVMGASGGAGQALQQGAEQNKSAAEIGVNAVTQGATGALAGGVTGGVLGGVGGLVGKALGKVGTETSPEAIQNATDFFNSPIGNKKISGGQLIKRLRGGQEPGLVRAGSIGADPTAIRIGKSLADLNLDPKNPLASGIKLADALDAANEEIKPYLTAETSPGVKRLVLSELENLKSKQPQEFIGDSTSKFGSMIDYAKILISKSKNTVGGYLDARQALDEQAKIQFPNAFKDGHINTGNAAGSALQMVRNYLNDNLYQIAPNGSQLQSLVKRQSDILRGVELAQPKIAKAADAGWMRRFLMQHPNFKRAGLYAAEGLGLGGVIHYAGGQQNQ